jgi:hypothetical protein
MRTTTRLREGTVVDYRGSRTDLHGPMTVMAVYPGGKLGLANSNGVLYGVRPESVRPAEET